MSATVEAVPEAVPEYAEGVPAEVDDPVDAGVVDAVVLASRALVGLAARSLAGLDTDVTLPQFRLLVVLASRGPQALGDLADALGVSPSTATRMCDRLVRKRLVRRTRPRHDRRQVRIALSPVGTSFVDAVFARRRADAARLLAQIPAHSKVHLVEALTAFAAAAGECDTPRLETDPG